MIRTLWLHQSALHVGSFKWQPGKLKQTSIARNHPVLLLTLPPTLDAKLYQRHNKKIQALSFVEKSIYFIQLCIYRFQFTFASLCGHICAYSGTYVL